MIFLFDSESTTKIKDVDSSYINISVYKIKGELSYEIINPFLLHLSKLCGFKAAGLDAISDRLVRE